MRGFVRERRYICRDYLEVEFFKVYEKNGHRGKRAKPTRETQARLNQRRAEREIVRLLHENFEPDDIEIHLTYRDECLPQSDDEADKAIRNYIRRVKRAAEKKGITDVKYLYTSPGTPGKARYHHHVTISAGLSREELEALWQYGYANSRRLQFACNGIEGLGHYISRQFKEDGWDKPKGKRRWSCSKNLRRPVPKDRDGEISQKKLEKMAEEGENNPAYFATMFPGYDCNGVRIVHSDMTDGAYIYLQLYRASGGGERKRQ